MLLIVQRQWGTELQTALIVALIFWVANVRYLFGKNKRETA